MFFQPLLKGPAMAAKTIKPVLQDDNHLVDAVRKSVDEIWQAGLGAFVRARHEGEEVFSMLVDEGAAVQKRLQQLAEDRLAGLTGTISKLGENVGRQASGSLEKLESALEERVVRSLKSIGVPTRSDFQELCARIDELRHSLDAAIVKKGSAKAADKAATTKKRTPPKSAKSSSVRTPAKPNGKRAGGSVSSRA
ncbi:polygranule-associated protein [Herbaspirillum sp. HC18]|nr:polygranule-associated protein [Herbaspirillum sp. HC18]